MTSFEYSTTASSKRPSSRSKVFINFQEGTLSHQFVGHLVADLKSHLCIDVEKRGGDLAENFQRIKESKIALVIFSSMYTTSSWCLNELVEIKQQVEEGKLVAIPILYKLDASVVKGLEGDFGLNLWNQVKRTSEFDELKKWKEALDFVSQKMDLSLSENSDEAEFLTSIVKEVKRQLKTVDNGILWDAKSHLIPKEGEFYGKSRNDDNLLDEANSDASPNLQNVVESKRVEPVKEEEKYVHGTESSNMATYDKHVPQHQVVIIFRGVDVRSNFVSHLVSALLKKEVNVFIDRYKDHHKDISELFKRIENSKIALVIFSSRFSESIWCLNDLVKIKKRMDEGKLRVIPISYKVDPSQVKQLNGDFGNKLWNLWRIHRDHDIIKWKEALESIASLEPMMRLCLKENSPESAFVTSIVEEVNKVLIKIPLQEGQNPSCCQRGKCTTFPAGRGEKPDSFPNKDKIYHSVREGKLFGIEKRMEQLEQKLEFDCKETRIIGVVGMPGIGKTTLAMMMHKKWNCKFVRCVCLLDIRKKSKDYGLVWLRTTLLKVLLGGKIPTINDYTTHESVENELLQTKVFVVLDDVSDKEEFKTLLGDLKWIKRGSRIVITTCDKSLLEGLAHDTYLVPQMDNKEAFELFRYHALDDQMLLARRISLDNAGGNPLALKLMGRELCGENESEHILQTAMHVWKFYIDQLNERQKDVFLDIVCFFKSEDEYFVRSILDSGDPDSTDAVSEVTDLADKFLITISDNRVEMNDLVYTYGEHLGRLEKNGPNVRGFFLDMSEVKESMALDNKTFTNMTNLRYLKIYDSFCPRQCKADWKLKVPRGLKFPLKEVRYFHWEKFPLEELPSDFKPENLVDLRLPYSKIARVWEGVKDTPRLKWIDLSYSKKLLNISALSKAENLLSLNLEGCLILDELPLEIQNMKSLAFLNLRGCICLKSFPEMNLISLKTLILTDCSRLTEFQLISESLENLHLDGTSIKGLPPTIKNLRRLVLLNLSNCKMLEFLPDSLCDLEYLDELILSGCSSLKNLPDVKHGMKHLQTLRLDGTGANEMLNILSFTTSESQVSADMLLQPSGLPHVVNGVSLLQRLCLSGNNFVSVQSDIGLLYNLKWLELKQCKRLRSVPMLPPRLEYFDAHGCDSLERVANPLALPVVTDHMHATFNFTNCNKLDQEAKDSIMSYTRRKSQLVLDALARYNGDIASEALFGTCFPGWEVPVWFSHRASGSVLAQKLPPPWFDNRFIGIALCAVIQFPSYNDQSNLSVKCSCVFKNENGSPISLTCIVGGWSESSNLPKKIESSHVFIGYLRRLDINQQEEGCVFNNPSLEFKVTDGTGEVVVGCDVMKCGFSLVYAPDERENLCWDAKTVEIPNVSGEEPILLGKSRSDHDIQYRPTEKLESDDPCSLSPERVSNVLGDVHSFGKSRRNNKINYQPHSSRMPRSAQSRRNNKIKYQPHSSPIRRSSSFDMMQSPRVLLKLPFKEMHGNIKRIEKQLADRNKELHRKYADVDAEN